MKRAWWLCALLVGLPGCARSCGAPPRSPTAPQAAPAPTRPAAPTRSPTPAPRHAAASLPSAVEAALSVRLPRRTQDAPFPGFATLPRRRLRSFDPEHHLVARLKGGAVTLLHTRVSAADSDALRAALRDTIEQWAQRSGTAATRLVVVVDRDATATAAARLRQVAMAAHTWRVVALARDGDRLMEVHLSPPGQRKP